MELLDKINWSQVIPGFLSGGALGALIKQFFDNRRNRIQPIGKSVEIKSVYDSSENKLLNSEISLTGTTQTYKFAKLYNGTIKIANTGLHDYASFTFGITCPDHVKIIHIKPLSDDRHHIAEIEKPPALENQVSYFDITLKPFNRKDSYIFDMLATTTEDVLSDIDVRISTPNAIKWVDLQSTTKLIVEIARESLLAIGPFTIGIRK